MRTRYYVSENKHKTGHMSDVYYHGYWVSTALTHILLSTTDSVIFLAGCILDLLSSSFHWRS